MAAVPGAELRQSAQRLTEMYRGDEIPGAMRTAAERAAYLVVRLPATYAAIKSAAEETAARVIDFHPASLLDLGSGPGTALWAASETFPSLREFLGLERDVEMAALGRKLAQENPRVRSTKWELGDVRNWISKKNFDLVIASYSAGELGKDERRRIVEQAWKNCEGALILVEPGTRKGFAVIAEARDQLLALGATLAGPCPHEVECPMRAAGDWCHFSVRVERTAEHRRLKEAELGHEDEKFSYVIASRLPVKKASARVVRHPLRFSGYTKLQLCTPEGLDAETVTRSNKEKYRQARKTEWGSDWEE